MDSSMKNCPKCDGEIRILATRCIHCREFIGEKPEDYPEEVFVEETSSEKSDESVAEKTSSRSRFPWVRFFVLLGFSALVFVMTVYEKNAFDLLREARYLHFSKNYDASALVSNVVLEKYPFSSSVMGAKKVLFDLKGKADPGMIDLEITDYGFFNQYKDYAFQAVVLVFCSAVLFVTFIARLRYRQFAFFNLVLFSLSAWLALIHLDKSGFIDPVILRDMYSFVSPSGDGLEIVFAGCYLLIFTSVMMVIRCHRRY